MLEVRFVSKSTHPKRPDNWDITFAQEGKLKGWTEIFSPEQLQEMGLDPQKNEQWINNGDTVEAEVEQDANGEILSVKQILKIRRD